MKKLLSVMFAVLLAFAACLPFTAMADSNDGADVVFVVDVSRSMQHNDPQYLTSLAINKYVDKLDASMQNNNVGIVTFCGDVSEQMPLTAITPDSVAQINQFVSDHVVQTERQTDASTGIKAAVDMLSSSQSSNKAIILVTDGEYSYAGADDKEPADAQTRAEASNTVMAEQVQKAQAQQIKIFTLKIKDDSTAGVPEFLKVDFAGVAKDTAGKDYYPNSADEVDEFISDIQSSLISGMVTVHEDKNVEAGVPTICTFNVPEGIVYAKVQISHDPKSKIEIISVKDKDGNAVNYDKPNVVKDKNAGNKRALTSFKIDNPAPGELNIEILSDQKQTISIDYAASSAFTIVAQPTQVTAPAKSPLKITAQLFQAVGTQNELVSDADGSLKIIGKVYDKDGKEVASQELSGKDGHYDTGKLAAPDVGDYTAVVSVQDLNGIEICATPEIPVTATKAKPNILLFVLIGVGVLVLVGLILLLLKKTGGNRRPPLFGKFQYSYSNMLAQEYESLQIWNLQAYSGGNKKITSASVYDLMKTYHQNLTNLGTVMFVTAGNNQAPQLQVVNNSSDLNVTISGIPISTTPTNINIGDELRIDSMDGSISISARRLA